MVLYHGAGKSMTPRYHGTLWFCTEDQVPLPYVWWCPDELASMLAAAQPDGFDSMSSPSSILLFKMRPF